MMRFKRGCFLLLTLQLLCFLASPAWADAPQVVKTIPPNGAVGVPTDLDQIEVFFDRNMKMNSYSVMLVDGASFPPLRPDDAPWETPIRFVLRIKGLEPNTRYALQLNSETKHGFQTAKDQVPLAPTLIRFETGAGPAGQESPTGTDFEKNSGPHRPASRSWRPPMQTDEEPLPRAADLSPSYPERATIDPAASSLIGRWLVRTPDFEIEAVLRLDGTFSQQMTTAEGTVHNQGRYKVSGDILRIYPIGDEPEQLRYRLLDADTLEVVDEYGEGVQMIRQDGPEPPSSTRAPAPERNAPPAGSPTSSAPSGGRPTLVMQRQWEPSEHAYSVLVPRGWQMQGGLFNIDPSQAGGPGNSIAPKNELTIRSDAQGRVMSHWLPSWSYADLSVEQPPAAQFFPIGSRYQGMEVKPMPTAEGFLMELFSTQHPGASDVQVVARDAFTEIRDAYQAALQPLNQSLAGLGKRPAQVDVIGLTLDYTEQGVRYREGLFTAILDMRSGALMWSNDLTYTTRAPADEADVWRPVLATIRTSLRLDPAWIEKVRRAMGERAGIALDTQRRINEIEQEIHDHRARTNAGINHENYLLITGQEEYVNPYTREVERDTAAYRHRWVNANGDYIYSDDDTFDPNRDSTLNHVEWRTTQVRAR